MKKIFYAKFLPFFFLSLLFFSAFAGFSTFSSNRIKNKRLLESTFLETKNTPIVVVYDLVGWNRTTFHEIAHVIFALLYPQYFSIDKVLLCKTQKILEDKGITSEICNGNTIGMTIYGQKEETSFIADKNDFLFKRLMQVFAGWEIVQLLFQPKFHLPFQAWNLSRDAYTVADLIRQLPPKITSSASKEIKKIIFTPRNLEFIHLLAQALYVLEIVEKDDIEFIYRNLAHPLHIQTKMQESKTTFSDRYYRKDVLKKINNYNTQNLKKLLDVIRPDLIKLKKQNIQSLNINKQTYSFSHLLANTNLSLIQINELKPQAKEELRNLLSFLEKPANEKPRTPAFSARAKQVLLNQSKINQSDRDQSDTSDIVITIILSLLSFIALLIIITFIYIKCKKQQLKSTKLPKTNVKK